MKKFYRNIKKTFPIFLSLCQAIALIVASCPLTNAEPTGKEKTLSLNDEKTIKKQVRLSTTDLPPGARVASASVARGFDGRVLVTWQDGGAKSSLGFNVYRQLKGGIYTKLNRELIAGASFSFEPKANEPVGGYFAWWDIGKFGRYYVGANYWIEYVGLDGKSAWHGPFAPVKGDLSEVVVERSRMITEIGLNESGATQELFSVENNSEKVDATSSEKSEAANEEKSFSSNTPEQDRQWQLAAGPAAKMFAHKNGWARIPRAQLLSAGLNLSDINKLRVFDAGVELAVNVATNGDLEFYGQKLDTPTTNKRAYWAAVTTDPGNGLRVQQINAGPFDNAIQSGFFTSTVERKDRSIRSTSILDGDKENFYGPVVSTTALNQSIQVDGLNSGASEQATLTVGVQGLTVQAHDVRVRINGNDVGSMTFNERENKVSQFQISHSWLREGKNVVTLTSQAPGSDFNLVDFVRLSYSRRLKSVGDRLRFGTTNNQAVRVDGFASSQIRVWDITDPMNVKEMLVQSQPDGNGGYAFTLPSGPARSFLAEGANASVYQPETVANQPSTLNGASNNFNFVIISHGKFLQAVEPLRALRQSQGLNVKVVDVEDVYDEFDFSIHGPTAIKAFLNHAKNNWQTPVQYVLLVGDATYDPKDYVGSGGQNTDLVPTKLVDSLFTETASDDVMADFNSDGLPELSLGRIAVRTVADANTVIGKLVNYETLPTGSTVQNGAVMVSDQPDGYDFEGFTNQVSAMLPASMTKTYINRASGDTATVRAQILSNINAGPGVVNYLGHGSVSSWTSAGLLTNSDAATLTNGNRQPLFVALTCLNGSFIEINIDSLAEAAQKSPNGGGVGVWASSGLTFPFGQVSISQSFYTQVFGASPPRVGDAIRQAKTATTDMDIRHLTVFFGDPTMRLR
jgi:hypothetical protein